MGGRGLRAAVGATAVATALVAVSLASCRPLGAPRPPGSPVRFAALEPIARGAGLYATYCAGCHGRDGSGHGPVADVLRLRPTDLRSSRALAGVADREVLARLLAGTPLRTAPRPNAFAEDLQVEALATYLAALSAYDWDRIRAGRLVYESGCIACHGAFGSGRGLLAGWLARQPESLQRSSARYTDAALVAVVRDGVGAMPGLDGLLAPDELRAVVAYMRTLSPGYRLYDTYCADCHGDDGRGVHPEDLLPPAIPAPPLHSATLARMTDAERRAAVLHMFRREQGLMPHFRDTLDPAQLADVVAYLRWRFP